MLGQVHATIASEHRFLDSLLLLFLETRRNAPGKTENPASIESCRHLIFHSVGQPAFLRKSIAHSSIRIVVGFFEHLGGFF